MHIYVYYVCTYISTHTYTAAGAAAAASMGTHEGHEEDVYTDGEKFSTPTGSDKDTTENHERDTPDSHDSNAGESEAMGRSSNGVSSKMRWGVEGEEEESEFADAVSTMDAWSTMGNDEILDISVEDWEEQSILAMDLSLAR